MKLYATVSSNRAKKSQGGDYLDIEIMGSDRRVAMTLHFEAEGERIIPSLSGGTPELIGELHNELSQALREIDEETKGKRQKGEECGRIGCSKPCLSNTDHCSIHQLP